MKAAATQSMFNNETRALVVGLGKTGLSCARYLVSQGVCVAISDSREMPPCLNDVKTELPDVALFLGSFEEDVFLNADLLVVSPGVPLETPQIQQAQALGVPVIGDIELFASTVNAPVIAITGSNGKSTVTTLLGEMARGAGRKTQLGGNLGEPALDLLSDDTELYVLELSSFQLESTHSLQAAAATVLNISADHMDRYEDLQHYTAVKAGMYQQTDVCVFNADDPRVMAMPCAGKHLYFTLKAVDDERYFNLGNQDGKEVLRRGTEVLIETSELLLPGRHNVSNALAALALGSAVDLPMDAMLNALRTFGGLSHRTEHVGENNGIRWYNDSKGTNPGATIAALKGMDSDDASKTVLIAGGDCKGADFTELGKVLGDTVRAVILMGVDAPMIEKVIPENIAVVHASDMQEAVALAAEYAITDDRVLLSPACASFDMFSGYEQRGEAFKKAVATWLK